MPQRKCKNCKAKKNPFDGVVINLKFFCDYDCAAAFGKQKAETDKRKENKVRLQELMKESMLTKKRSQGSRGSPFRPYGTIVSRVKGYHIQKSGAVCAICSRMFTILWERKG